MSLKNKLNKMKNFLFDEEEEKEEKKNIKPNKENKIEKKTVEISKEDFSDNDVEKLYLEEDLNSSNTSEFKSRVVKKEPEFKFPEYDDDDFVVTKPREIYEEPKTIVKEEPRVTLYQGSKRKEESKKFKPSPIISPIYGLLDKEGNQFNKKKDVSYANDKDEVSLDDIRKKAYGSLDEELENTLKRISSKTIEEAQKDMEKEELELSREKNKSKKEKAIIPSSIKIDEDDDMILPNINFKEIDVDKERVSSTQKSKVKIEEDDDTKEHDLFNLIDDMYSKKGNDE